MKLRLIISTPRSFKGVKIENVLGMFDDLDFNPEDLITGKIKIKYLI